MHDTAVVTGSGPEASYLATWEIGRVRGPAVAIDVVRAFTTAAFAFASGADRIWLVDSVPQALSLVAANPTWLAMGEDRGIRPEGFALSNSPILAGHADLAGRTLVHRTSAGTRGAVAAARAGAQPLLCASLVVASATAAMLRAGPAPTYVITGRFADDPANTGAEDEATARYLEAVRLGRSTRQPHAGADRPRGPRLRRRERDLPARAGQRPPAGPVGLRRCRPVQLRHDRRTRRTRSRAAGSHPRMTARDAKLRNRMARCVEMRRAVMLRGTDP